VMNAYRLDAGQAKSLSGLGRPGRSVLWMYAPGLFEAKHGVLGTRDPARMRELTGLELQVDDTSHQFSVVAKLADGAETSFDAGAGRPVVWCSDSSASTLATYKDTGRCAVAVKDRGGWLSMWSGVTNVSIPLLREMAKKAGVHMFSDSGDAFYAGHGTITIHSNQAGAKKIVLPGRFDVEEVFAEMPLKVADTPIIELDMKSYETRVFRVRERE
jgi:beta-galactosidase